MDSLLADDRRCLSSVGIDGAASAETPESCSNVGHVLLTSVIFQLTDSSLNLENVDHIIYIYMNYDQLGKKPPIEIDTTRQCCA